MIGTERGQKDADSIKGPKQCLQRSISDQALFAIRYFIVLPNAIAGFNQHYYRVALPTINFYDKMQSAKVSPVIMAPVSSAITTALIATGIIDSPIKQQIPPIGIPLVDINVECLAIVEDKVDHFGVSMKHCLHQDIPVEFIILDWAACLEEILADGQVSSSRSIKQCIVPLVVFVCDVNCHAIVGVAQQEGDKIGTIFVHSFHKEGGTVVGTGRVHSSLEQKAESLHVATWKESVKRC